MFIWYRVLRSGPDKFLVVRRVGGSLSLPNLWNFVKNIFSTYKDNVKSLNGEDPRMVQILISLGGPQIHRNNSMPPT